MADRPGSVPTGSYRPRLPPRILPTSLPEVRRPGTCLPNETIDVKQMPEVHEHAAVMAGAHRQRDAFLQNVGLFSHRSVPSHRSWPPRRGAGVFLVAHGAAGRLRVHGAEALLRHPLLD